MKNFHDNQHAQNRLQRCWVGLVKDDGTIIFDRVEDADKKTIILNRNGAVPLHDEKVIITLPELGYVNTRFQCALLERDPKRMWKAGFAPENTRAKYIFPEWVTGRDDMGLGAMLEYITNNKYPTIEQALHEVQNGVAAARAFSPRFAVGRHERTKEIVLYYRNSAIGHYENGNWLVGDVYSHLVEQFFEVTGKEFIS